MSNIEQYGLYRGKGKHYEEIIYASALIYGLVHQRISDYLKAYDLTVGKLNILIAVQHHGGDQGVSQVELSKHLIVTPSNMTKMIDKLEKDGFLTRSALDGDRRVNMIQATTKAKNILNDLWPGFQAAMKENVKGLSSAKQAQLAELLLEWFGELKA